MYTVWATPSTPMKGRPTMAHTYLYRLKMIGRLYGQNTVTSFAFGADAPAGAKNTHTLDIISAFVTDREAAFIAAASEDWQLTGYYCHRLNNQGGIPGRQPRTALFGGVAGGALPPHTCGLVVSYVAPTNRMILSKLWVPGVPVAHNNDGEPSAAYNGLLTTIANEMDDGLAGADLWDSVIYSPKDSTDYDIDTAEPMLKFGVMTSRKTGPLMVG